MSREQRFFRRAAGFAVVLWAIGAAPHGLEAEDVTVADGRIFLKLPLGWEETDLNARNALAGWATADNRNSVFLQAMDPGSGGSMDDLLRNTVKNFENNYEVKEVQDFKTGQVNGPEKKWPAIFTILDANVAKGEKDFEMRFYMMIFDTGTGLYFFQGSTTIPVNKGRENEILGMMRSIVAKS